MGMVVGIDQARRDQPPGRIDHVMLAVGCEIGAERGAAAGFNEVPATGR